MVALMLLSIDQFSSMDLIGLDGVVFPWMVFAQ
jgi:hypothetical protein